MLVHGSSGSAFSWRLVAPLLEDRFTVYAMQRRGRGHSGDSEEYSIEREGEDIAALIEAIDGPVNLVGHSYGANCALEAGLLARDLRRLVLYEPAVEWPNPEGHVERLEALLAEGRDEEALLAELATVGLTDEEMEALRSSPTWPERVALARTLPREARACEAYAVATDRFASFTTPTLLLTGEKSEAVFRAGVDRVAAALPNSRTVVLAGQGHAANLTAPELLAAEISGFLAG